MDEPKSDESSTPPLDSQGSYGEQSEFRKNNSFENLFQILTHFGMGEVGIRISTIVLTIALVIFVVFLMGGFYGQLVSGGDLHASAAPLVTPTLEFSTSSFQFPTPSTDEGISRDTTLHTSIPSRPRIDIIKYTVQKGDSVFGIADKFGLNPSTILFGNYDVLKDTPHSLRPNQVLTILPVDGTYYEWQGTENLQSVAQFFAADVDAIINYPGNHLDPDAIGDLASPNIPAGTWLIIPGGRRAFISWGAPIGVTRDKPAIARTLGEGSCGAIEGGAVGFGTYVWPTNEHYLSGYDFSPETNHYGIDLAGNTGNAIYATDSGVVVYAGWNDNGYGNLIIIDHGGGWQSLYAHLSAFNVSCGQSVAQGQVIGAMGSTGNSSGSHLHFELMSSTYNKVNPLNFLPPP